MSERWPNLGLLALVVAAGGLLTGPFLALNYAPTLESARDSVAYIDGEVALGGLLRAVHHWAGTLAILLAAAHGARLFWRGRYKSPRRFSWMLGCLVFLVLIAFAYTGYLLPGDDRAYTGMGVMRGIAASTPVVGEQAAAVLTGGADVSSATLTRLNVAHTVLLPAALIALLAVYLRRRRSARTAEAPVGTRAWVTTLSAVLPLLLVMVLLALLLPPTLGSAPEPTGGAAPDAKPEWFFLWVNELLRLLPGREFLIGAVLPGLLVGAAVLLPVILRGRDARPARRIPEIAAALLVVLGIAGLTLSSLATAADAHEGHAHGEAETRGAAGELQDRAASLIGKFRCSRCHTIDGDEEGGDLGPELRRRGGANQPPFAELYTRGFFRLKVSDPRGFWPDTGMVYPKSAGLPSVDEIRTLEQWFFDDNDRALGPEKK